MLVRKSKSDLKLSMKAEIAKLSLTGPAQIVEFAADLKAAGRIHALELSEAEVAAIVDVEFVTEQ